MKNLAVLVTSLLISAATAANAAPIFTWDQATLGVSSFAGSLITGAGDRDNLTIRQLSNPDPMSLSINGRASEVGLSGSAFLDRSALGATSISVSAGASGSVTGQPFSAGASGSWSNGQTFTLGEAAVVEISYSIVANVTGAASASGQVQLRTGNLATAFPTILYFDVASAIRTSTFASSAQVVTVSLNPGQYTFGISGNAGGQGPINGFSAGSATAAMSAQLRFVPEPGLSALMCFGLTLLAQRARD